MRRKSALTDAELITSICSRLKKGESLRKICEDETVCSSDYFYKIIDSDKDAAAQYARARIEQAHNLAAEIIEIADDGRRDYEQAEDGRLVPDHDHIQRSKLRVDARKWYASKLAPKLYGERLQHANDEENPLVTNAETMSEAQIVARLAEIQASKKT